MNNSIYLVTQCIKNKKNSCVCHFKGFYSGFEIKQIIILANKSNELVVGEEYVIYAEISHIKSYSLFCSIIWLKNIKDISNLLS